MPKRWPQHQRPEEVQEGIAFEIEAMEMFETRNLCINPNCGWHGKASKTKLLRILPFNWNILLRLDAVRAKTCWPWISPASAMAPSSHADMTTTVDMDVPTVVTPIRCARVGCGG